MGENFNKVVRMTNTKEEHSGVIIKLVTEYCLAQRVKPVGAPKSPFKSEAEYIEAVKAHHAVLLAAVACKQQAELAAIEKLEAAVGAMSAMYPPSSPAAVAPQETTCGGCAIH